MAEFTREYLDDARIEGYTDNEIISHITKTRPDILNALESGSTLNEIADYFSKNAPPKKEEEAVAEDPSLGRVATGLAAEIAVAEGAKYAGAAAGAAIGGAASAPTAGIASPVTVPSGAAIGYVVGALGGGWTGSLLAQEIEGATEYNYGRATIDTALNLIPGFKIGKTGKLAKVTGAIAKRPIATGMIVGGVATPTYMAVEEAQGKKDYTIDDYLKGAGTSMALGLGLGAAEKAISKGILKIRNKTPSEINKLIEAGDPTAIQLVDYLTAGLTPADVKMAPSKFKGSVSDFIKSSTRSTTAALAPSRVIGDEATTLAKQAKSAVEAAEGTASNIGKQIDSYLEANPQYRDDSIAFLDGEDRPNLPPELLEKLVFGRNRIRTEQQRMLDLHNSGAKLLPENKAEIIEESLNRGDYLTRAYEFFQNPNYKPSKEKYDALKLRLTTGLTEEMKNARMKEFISNYKIPREEVEAIRRFHGIRPGGDGKSNAAYQKDIKASFTPSKDRIAAFQKKLDEEKMTDAQANEYLAELQLKMKGNPVDFSAFMQGSGTPNVLKQRKVVSKELEDYLGLITEPGRRVGTTMSVLNRINEYNEADARIAKVLLDSGAAVKSSDPRANVQGLQPLNLKRGEFEIDGEKLLVDPTIQTALNKIYAGGIDEVSNSVTSRTIRDIYDTSVSAFKSAKVLGNLSSYLIQIPSNIAGTLGAGMNPMLGLGNAVRMSLGTLSGTKVGGLPIIKKMANEAPPLTLQKFEDLKKRGMITGNIAYEDLKAGLQGKRLGKAFQKATDTPGKIYSLPDNIFRIVNYENNMDVLKKIMPTATDEQIKDMGARLTTRTYPNFESVSPEVKALSRTGIMPQFVTYSLEFARTQFEQAKLIREMMNGTFASKLGNEFKDIPVNQAALKKEAAKRLVAMGSAYAAASYGLNELNRESLTPEQERAYRDTVAADFERDKPLFIKKDKDGSFTSVNTGYYLPQTILANPVMSVIRGENAEEGTGNLLKVFKNELLGEGSFAAQAFASLASGRDFETGKLISNAPTAIGQASDRAQNFSKELVPSTVTALQKQDKTFQEKAARQAGLRIDKRTIPEGFGFKARGINEAINNIKSTMSGKQYALTDGKISPEEYQASIADEQNNYAANIDMMINHVKNLKTLGETDETIIPMLKDAKFSSIDILNLLEGKNVPFDPTKKKTTVEMLDEIAGANDLETRQNIRDLVRKDPINGNKVLGAYKDRMRNVGIVQSPRESLLAGLPTDEKVKRIFPEIQASSNPDAEIRRLIKKKILTESDLEAIRIRQKLGSN
jgi:hypothetical protein